MTAKERLIVFDLDQTLIANAGMTAVWEDICRRRGADLEHALETWHGSAGRPLVEQVAEAFRISTADVLVDEIITEFWGQFDHQSPSPIDGAAETLDALYEDGVVLYLSTASDPRPVDSWLRVLDWHRYFRLVLATDRQLSKGAGHYARMIADSGLRPDEFGRRALAVGDGAYDMRFALEHGVRLRVGYAPASSTRPSARERLVSAGANLVIEDLRALRDIVHHPDAASVERWRA